MGVFQERLPLELEQDISPVHLAMILNDAAKEAARFFAAAGGQIHEGPCERDDVAYAQRGWVAFIWRGSRETGQGR